MKKNLKILTILPWGENGPAGAERSISSLLNNISNKDFDLEIIIIAKKIDKADIINTFNKKIKVNVIYSSRARYSILKIAKIIRKSNPDILIGNVVHVCTITILAKLLSLKKCKIISINRGINLKNPMERIHSSFLYFFSDKIVLVSHGIKKQLEKTFNFNEKKTEVIYNPFEIDEIKKKSLEPLDEDWPDRCRDGKVIIYVGRLDNKSKNINFLVESFSIVQKSENINLIIIGDGEDKQEIKKLTKKLGISDNVHFLGWKSNPYPSIRKSNLLVLSSNFEGFGRVLVESMICGTPVVSTNCPGGPSEILDNGNYGKLVPMGNVELFSKAIKESLEKPMPAEILERRAEYFSVERAVDKYLDLINSL